MRWLRGFLAALVLGSLALTGCGHTSNQPTQSGDGSTGTTTNAQQTTGSTQAANGEAQGPAGQNAKQPANYQVTIPDGTPIAVRLTDSIGSARSAGGERFDATLDQPIVVNNSVVVPQGARVTGRVLVARPSGHLKTPAELAVTLTSLEVGGQSYEIATSQRSWRGKSHKGRNAKWIAGASGAGALIGALVGHGEGALIGAGIGLCDREEGPHAASGNRASFRAPAGGDDYRRVIRISLTLDGRGQATSKPRPRGYSTGSLLGGRRVFELRTLI